MEVTDSDLPFVGLQIPERNLRIHESIFRKNARTSSMLEDIEVGLQVRVSVRIILPDTVPL